MNFCLAMIRKTANTMLISNKAFTDWTVLSHDQAFDKPVDIGLSPCYVEAVMKKSCPMMKCVQASHAPKHQEHRGIM